MAWELAEPLADAINTYLSTNIDARLTAIETEIGDGIDLEAPQYYYVSEYEAEAGPERRSSITTTVDSFVAAQSDWNIGSYLDPTYEVRIIIRVVDQDHNDRRRKLYRYTRAVVECIDNSRGRFDGYNVGTLTGFSVAYEEPENQSALATITTTAKKIETRS